MRRKTRDARCLSHLPSFEVSLHPFVVPFNKPQKVTAPTLGQGRAKQQVERAKRSGGGTLRTPDAPTLGQGRAKQQVERAKMIRQGHRGHLTSSWHPP
jgi:hypothetical protein